MGERLVGWMGSYGIEKGNPLVFFLFLFVYIDFMPYYSWKASTFSGLKCHCHHLFSLIFCLVYLRVYYYCYIIIMFKKNLIMTQDHIDCLQNLKNKCLVLFGSTLCQIMELLQPKTGNTLKIWFWFLSVFNNLMSSCSWKS